LNVFLEKPTRDGVWRLPVYFCGIKTHAVFAHVGVQLRRNGIGLLRAPPNISDKLANTLEFSYRHT